MKLNLKGNTLGGYLFNLFVPIGDCHGIFNYWCNLVFLSFFVFLSLY